MILTKIYMWGNRDMYINKRNLCIGCMKPLGTDGICPYCGLNQEEYRPIPRCLSLGTVLLQRYVTGRVLGEGAFGITYIGWDTFLDIPVAIKEYFPSDMVSRDVICGSGNEVYLYENEKKKDYDTYLKKFLGEAQCLSQLNQIKGIVSVRDFFYENNTAYIVMQNIEGISVREYVKRNGKVPAEQVLEMFRPVLEALDKVHGMGIIHRDISPDNLIVKTDGSLVLIDFGAARIRNIDNTKTITVMFKSGFSPEEQYQYKGKWGAYTDIYSLCATMYYMITATVPMDSIRRSVSDDMLSLVDMREISLPSKQKRALMKGMEIVAEKRYQTISQLCEALYGEGEKEEEEGRQKRCTFLESNRTRMLIASVVLLLIAGGVVWYDYVGQITTGQEVPVVTPDVAVPNENQNMYEMISLTNQPKEKVEQLLKKYGDNIHITWKKEYSSTVTKDCVVSQSIAAGEKFTESESIELVITVSNGVKKRTVPELTGKTKTRVKEILAQRNLKAEFVSEPSSSMKGTVICQSVKAGKKVREGKKLVITISEGKTSLQTTARPQERQKNDFIGVIQ